MSAVQELSAQQVLAQWEFGLRHMKLVVTILMGILAIGCVWSWRKYKRSSQQPGRGIFFAIAIVFLLLLLWFLVAVFAAP